MTLVLLYLYRCIIISKVDASSEVDSLTRPDRSRLKAKLVNKRCPQARSDGDHVRRTHRDRDLRRWRQPSSWAQEPGYAFKVTYFIPPLKTLSISINKVIRIAKNWPITIPWAGTSILYFFCQSEVFAATQITKASDNNPFSKMSTIIIIIDCHQRRASNIPYADLRHIIIVGNMTFVEREWGLLRNMPKISIMNGNPLNRADIRAVKVKLFLKKYIYIYCFWLRRWTFVGHVFFSQQKLPRSPSQFWRIKRLSWLPSTYGRWTSEEASPRFGNPSLSSSHLLWPDGRWRGWGGHRGDQHQLCHCVAWPRLRQQCSLPGRPRDVPDWSGLRPTPL